MKTTSSNITAMSPDEARAFLGRCAATAPARKKELTQWLNSVCNNAKRLNETYSAVRDAGKTQMGRECGLVEMTRDEMLANANKIMRLLFDGKTHVKNAKGKGDWNVGTMGSNWMDWESDDGKTTCRIAWKCRKFTTEDDPWTIEEDYALLLAFEKTA
jgi:hypothetical protein